MLQTLEWIYGANAQSDPYFQVLRDFVVLVPWWYPYIWLAIIAGVVLFRGARRWRTRRLARQGLLRVKRRTERLLGETRRAREILTRRRRPANDVEVPSFSSDSLVG